MPSFDIVNELDMQKIDNAINVASRKLLGRYDFKGLKYTLELNKKEKTLLVEVPDDMKFKALQQIVIESMIDQKVSPKVVEWGKQEDAALGSLRIKCKLVEGIDKEASRKITAAIKESGLKVKSSIQGEQIRVEGKQIDDLQAVQKLVSALELPMAVQFQNYKK